MRICLFIFFIFTNYSFSFPDLSSFNDPRSDNELGGYTRKDIKTDVKLFYVHQYHLDLAFGRVNDYLCLIKNTEYQNFSNLGTWGSYTIGYEAILNNQACQNGEVNLPWLVVSKQLTSTDNLVVEMLMPNKVADPRIKLILEEETSVANPYGVLTLDYNYVMVLPTPHRNKPIYNATYESSILPNNQVQFESAVYLDLDFLDAVKLPLSGSYPVGQRIGFYSSKILHNQNSDGFGTVTERIFDAVNVSPSSFIDPGRFPAGYPKNYPDGIPWAITTTNFAYNENVVKYEITYGYTGSKNVFYPDTGPLAGTVGVQSSSNNELCVSRTGSWEYIPQKNYGVYDTSGDRIDFSTVDPAQAQTADYSFATTNTLWDGKIKILSSRWLDTGLQCKKLADGSSYGDGLCPGTANGDVLSIIRINGYDYQNFPLFDVPEGTILTVDQNGQEYYVRQLGPTKVYPARPQGDADCDSLTIKDSLDTPDHTFFNYPVIDIPATGGILVNKLPPSPIAGDNNFDLFAGGHRVSAYEDDDGDGILNYRDSFPFENTLDRDFNHDNVPDVNEGNVGPPYGADKFPGYSSNLTICCFLSTAPSVPFTPDLTDYKYLDKDMYSNYLK